MGRERLGGQRLGEHLGVSEDTGLAERSRATPPVRDAAPERPAGPGGEVRVPDVSARRRDALPVLRVLAVALALALLALALGARLLPDAPRVVEPALPSAVVLALFALVEVTVLHVQVRREAQTVALSEIPMVLGLFLLPADELVAARVVGAFAVFVLVRRSSPIKLVFNTALVAANVTLALTVFTALGSPALDDTGRAWLAAFLAVAAAGALDAGATTLVIAAYEWQLAPVDLLREPAAEAVRAVLVANVGLIAVYALTQDLVSALPLAIVTAALLLGYRAYAKLTDRHLALERLYRFSRVVSSSPEMEQVLRTLLGQARELLRADVAEVAFLSAGASDTVVRVSLGADGVLARREIVGGDADPLLEAVLGDQTAVLLPRGTRRPEQRALLAASGHRDAVVAPLRGDAGVVGTLLVADRLGEVRTFDAEDVKLLETVANHAGVALSHGNLVEQLRHDALHDALTGLPNRVHLHQELERRLATTAAGGSGFALGLMDLDGFKEVNDSLGHQHGDQLLVEVARRLDAATGAHVVRLGGDEFAFVMPGVVDVRAAEAFSRGVLQALEQPVDLGVVSVEVAGSIGVAVCPQHGTDPSGLLKRADLAMYEAKAVGAGVRAFEAAMEGADPARLALVGELRSALDTEQLVVEVQPVASLATGLVTGVEVLVRWDHPVYGRLPPDDFVPAAERSGLIRPLTSLVLSRALGWCATWLAEGRELSVAVNLSVRSLADGALVDEVRRLLADAGVPARLLTLEITESGVMLDPARAMAVLRDLRALGVRLSVDDFGTGYSSLSYLKRLPVHEVKIDKSFVTDVWRDVDDATIVRSIVDLAHNLDLDVVAEGVEGPQSWAHVERVGCTSAQGYHLARPMPPVALSGWLAAREGTLAAGVNGG